ncbi:MAG: DUF1640 domain-containing protein [Thermus sp.]|uniref:DUF1640 domain-containing protein n=1 Tax=Thermus sp. TaxID=275 RepID=UPI0025F8D762|nr:DUF1640 domain-containing protein [Thermus sp.]MCS7219560.1 DUF1640 domain-containing protein [Thermus sp.]
MTTEERLLKLEGMVEAVVRLLPERIASLENRLEAFRQELKGEIHALREEVRQEVASLRGEVGQQVASLRGEVRQQVTSLRGEMNTLRGEMAALRQEVKAEINTAFNRTVLVFTALAVILGLLDLLP